MPKKKEIEITKKDDKHIWIDSDVHHRLDIVKAVNKCGSMSNAIKFLLDQCEDYEAQKLKEIDLD